MYKKDFDEIIRNRVLKRLSPFAKNFEKAGIKEFYIAGNSLNLGPVNDIDLYPVIQGFIEEDMEKFGKIVFKSKNAYTVLCKNTTFQFCNYLKSALNFLVDSFDFAHIQIGACVRIGELESDIIIEETYFSSNYIIAKLRESTWFIGSEYPTSSLIRMFKYHKRGNFSGKSFITSVIRCMTNILKRGFYSYEDFKDQIDAVDLGLTESDFPDKKILKEFFNLLSRKTKEPDRLIDFNKQDGRENGES